jgi:hypothetical protein
MLASTVQFSNNDQPPITPGSLRSSLGPATEEVHSLRHPTACPTRSFIQTHVPRRSSTSGPFRPTVPNNQRSTHEQPAPDIRRCTGLWTARRPRSAP